VPITLHRHQFPPYHRRHHHRCNNPWKLQWYLGVPSASSCIAETHKHTRRDACHCVPAPSSGQLGRAPEHIKYCGLPPAALLTSDVTYGTYFRGARRRIPHALSHGHRQPSCTIYENKRAPPSGHAWHPPGWRQPRVSCSALSPFSCFRGGRCVPGDRTRPLSRV
jgi:hypothetical protein